MLHPERAMLTPKSFRQHPGKVVEIQLKKRKTKAKVGQVWVKPTLCSLQR